VREGSDRIELHGATPCWERYPDAVPAPLSSGHRRREPEKNPALRGGRAEPFSPRRWRRDPNGEGLPWFVEREFRNYLDCGILSRGFCRAVCPRCGHEIVVGLSCKGRGCCPSCTTRRMLDTAAHLVDRVLPMVPYRQVLAFPRSLRLRLGYEKAFFVAARRIVLAAIFNWQRRAGTASPSPWSGRSRSPRDLLRTCHCIRTSTSSCRTEFSSRPMVACCSGRCPSPPSRISSVSRRGSRDESTGGLSNTSFRASHGTGSRSAMHRPLKFDREPASIPHRLGPQGSRRSSRASLSRPAAMSTSAIAQALSACADMGAARRWRSSA